MSESGPLRGRTPSVVKYSHDGQFYIIGSEAGNIYIREAHTHQIIKTINGHTHRILDGNISSDDRFFVTASHDYTLKIWDIKTGKCLKTLSGHTNSILSVYFYRDQSQIVSVSQDKTIRFWDIKTGQCLKIIYLIENTPPQGLFCTGDQKTLLSATGGAWRYFHWGLTDLSTNTLSVVPFEAIDGRV